jgi:outer membrane immunogenic protein
MKKLFLCTVASVAVIAVAPANAADLRMPVKAPRVAAPAYPAYMNWTGCHVGAHVGWGWAKKDGRESSISESSKFTGFGFTSDDVVFGGQLGCDYQFSGNWVVGLEGMIAGTSISGTGSDAPFDSGDSENSTVHMQVDWLASITARLGFAGWMPETLWYVKGGAAWVRDKWDLTNALIDFQPTVASTRSGWTIGVGVERALGPSASVFLEYDYYDFGTGTVTTFVDDDDLNSLNVKQRIHTLKVGFNYRFSPWLGKAPIAGRY